MTQMNLGIALSRSLGEGRGDADLLDQAVTAFREALQERTRDRVPLQWAMTQANLATAERARFGLTQDAPIWTRRRAIWRLREGCLRRMVRMGILPSQVFAEIQAGIDACRRTPR